MRPARGHGACGTTERGGPSKGQQQRGDGRGQAAPDRWPLGCCTKKRAAGMFTTRVAGVFATTAHVATSPAGIGNVIAAMSLRQCHWESAAVPASVSGVSGADGGEVGESGDGGFGRVRGVVASPVRAVADLLGQGVGSGVGR